MQVLTYSVASVGVSAFSSGVIDASKAEEVMNILRSMTEESQQVRTEGRFSQMCLLDSSAFCCLMFLKL